MTNIRPFTCEDLFTYGNVNLDPLTETYGLFFYLQYLTQWPEYFQVVESPDKQIVGYIMGKSEGLGDNWHGHVTALSIDYLYRRLSLAAKLMKGLEQVSIDKDCFFVDLFVRVSNKIAVEMYRKLDYSVYRKVLEYYMSPDEDAYDMRKAMPRDKEKKSIRPLPHPVRAEDLD